MHQKCVTASNLSKEDQLFSYKECMSDKLFRDDEGVLIIGKNKDDIKFKVTFGKNEYSYKQKPTDTFMSLKETMYINKSCWRLRRVCNGYADTRELYYITPLLYTPPFLNINIFNFVLSSIDKEGSQWSKDGKSLEEYKCSPPVKSKGITTMNENVYKSVDIVSNSIKPPRDKNRKMQYQFMLPSG